MSIQESQLAPLRAFGYTEVEARFLYLAATHSGYFTVRQFLDFARAKSGKRNARLVEKLFAFGHITAQRYRRRSLVYHLHSLAIYNAIGKGNLRNRRGHELGDIKTRLLALDYILAHPDDDYFETAGAKREYFIRRFKASENFFLPTKENGKAITFADRFPLCVTYPSPEFIPVVTFTYIDSEQKSLEPFIAHLRRYRPLFRLLPGFQFLYISTASGQQKEAAELFGLFAEAKGLADLMRYFDLQTKWDNKQYGLLSEADVISMSEGRKRFTGDSIDTLYYLWKRNQLPKDLQMDAAPRLLFTQKILFRAVTVPGHEGIFGNNTRRWSDGWQIRSTSGDSSPRKSPATPAQSLQEKADT
ncbi:MAG TPA: hypothetical protein VJN92_14230 [Candidatus Acidoferrum sp.]|nr:hypothetical protein [Candidatus Acidoferrum sp.]